LQFRQCEFIANSCLSRKGSKVNYQNLARYIRKNIDKKVFFTKQPQAPIENVTEALFHVDENLAFETVSDYEAYIRKHNFYHEGGEKVVVFTGIHDPFSGNKEHLDSLIVSLQRSGLNVYPITSKQKRIDFLEKIQPAAVIYFPHGRLLSGQPDDAVNWLKKRNIPIFYTTLYFTIEGRLDARSNGHVRRFYGANDCDAGT